MKTIDRIKFICYHCIIRTDKEDKKMNYNMVLTPEQWKRMRPQMRASGINYEPSGYGSMVYVGGTCSPAEYDILGAWVEEL